MEDNKNNMETHTAANPSSSPPLIEPAPAPAPVTDTDTDTGTCTCQAAPDEDAELEWSGLYSDDDDSDDDMKFHASKLWYTTVSLYAMINNRPDEFVEFVYSSDRVDVKNFKRAARKQQCRFEYSDRKEYPCYNSKGEDSLRDHNRHVSARREYEDECSDEEYWVESKDFESSTFITFVRLVWPDGSGRHMMIVEQYINYSCHLAVSSHCMNYAVLCEHHVFQDKAFAKEYAANVVKRLGHLKLLECDIQVPTPS